MGTSTRASRLCSLTSSSCSACPYNNIIGCACYYRISTRYSGTSASAAVTSLIIRPSTSAAAAHNPICNRTLDCGRCCPCSCPRCCELNIKGRVGRLCLLIIAASWDIDPCSRVGRGPHRNIRAYCTSSRRGDQSRLIHICTLSSKGHSGATVATSISSGPHDLPLYSLWCHYTL
jgi:hypothetical protein